MKNVNNKKIPMTSTTDYQCTRVGKTVQFTLKGVKLYGSHILPAAIAYAPKCSGWSACGAFANGFPQELWAIPHGTKTGCPYFDNRTLS